MIAGAVVAAGGTAYSTYSSMETADEMQDLANQQATKEEDYAQKEADEIREKARRLKASQNAALAASGIKLDEGTAGTIVQETDRLSEQDALAAIKEGKDRASLIRAQGRIDAGSRTSSGIATALGGASSVLGSVTSYRKATEGSRTAGLVNIDTDKIYKRTAPKYSLLSGG
jgi:hypothetical protein